MSYVDSIQLVPFTMTVLTPTNYTTIGDCGVDVALIMRGTRIADRLREG